MLSGALRWSAHPHVKLRWTEGKHFTSGSHRKILSLAASYRSDKRGQKTPMHILAPRYNTQHAATRSVAACCARTRAKPIPGSTRPRTSTSPPCNMAKQGMLPWLPSTDGMSSSFMRGYPITSCTNTACISSYTYQGWETVPSSQRGDMSFPERQIQPPIGDPSNGTGGRGDAGGDERTCPELREETCGGVRKKTPLSRLPDPSANRQTTKHFYCRITLQQIAIFC